MQDSALFVQLAYELIKFTLNYHALYASNISVRIDYFLIKYHDDNIVM